MHAPVTEVLMAYFPLTLNDADKAKWEEAWQGLVKPVKQAKGFVDIHGGWVIEEMEVEGLKGMRKAWMGTLGWENLDAHVAFTKTEVFKGIPGMLMERAEKLEGYHVELS